MLEKVQATMDENEKTIELKDTTLQTIIKDHCKNNDGKLHNEKILETKEEDDKKAERDDKKKREERAKEFPHADPRQNLIKQLLKESSIVNSYFIDHGRFTLTIKANYPRSSPY